MSPQWRKVPSLAIRTEISYVILYYQIYIITFLCSFNISPPGSHSLPKIAHLLVLICPSLNIHTYRFTVDFVITYSVHRTIHILMCISLPETLSNIRNQIRLHCLSMDIAINVSAIFNRLLRNFACTLEIPSITCARSFGATVLSFVENGGATQNFWNTRHKRLFFKNLF